MSEGFSVSTSGQVMTLSFTRPSVGNALGPELSAPLRAVFESATKNPAVRTLLIRGDGKHFCTGGDVQSFDRVLQCSPEERRADFASRLDAVTDMVQAYLAVDVPVIVACQGAIAGAGLLFPLGADHVLVDSSAKFIFAHVMLGLTPDGGVSVLLPHVVGARRAASMLMGAQTVNAAEALAVGIADEIAEPAALQELARKRADRFASMPRTALALTKRLIHTSRPFFEDGLRAERDAIVQCVGENDFVEGVRAFVEKRPAKFGM